MNYGPVLAERVNNDLQSRYAFEGDAQVATEDYRQIMGKSYIFAFQIAEASLKAMGYTMSPAAAECSKRMTMAANIYDDLLDEGDNPAVNLTSYRHIIGALATGEYAQLEYPPDGPSMLKPSTTLLGSAMVGFDERRRQRFLEAATTIGDVSVQKRRTSDPMEYQNILVREGRASGSLLALAALHDRPDSLGSKNVTFALERMASILTLHDSLNDLEDDHAAGLTQVDPTDNWSYATLRSRAALEKLSLRLRLPTLRYRRVVSSLVEKPHDVSAVLHDLESTARNL